MIVCVVLPAPVAEASILEALARAAPRVVLEPERAWLDARGLPAAAVHARLIARLGHGLRSGASLRPIVAWVAASQAAGGALNEVAAGEERAYLAPAPLSALGLEDPLLGWLADVGIGRCEELASVSREALEVRFGGEIVQWWQWSRGVDERRLFAPSPPVQPHAQIDFVDYVVTDPERLIFTTNALLGGLCEQLRAHGSHARQLRLRLPLADGSVWERTLRSARPTADRAAWLRLARGVLERLTVPDAVAGIGLEVVSTEAAGAQQGDLFDTGFATAAAVESAVARLLEDNGPVVQEPAASAHPLAEVRVEYQPLNVREVMSAWTRDMGATAASDPIGLTLQLLAEPRPVTVETARRRDHEMPTRYRDQRWHTLLHAAGPDRVSGGQWDTNYAREYFRAVRDDGTLIWLYRDAGRERWFLHGWWD